MLHQNTLCIKLYNLYYSLHTLIIIGNVTNILYSEEEIIYIQTEARILDVLLKFSPYPFVKIFSLLKRKRLPQKTVPLRLHQINNVK